MEQLILSIADIRIAVRVEKHLEGFLAPLTTLFSGFLSNASEPAAFLNVSYDHLRTYPNFKDMTADLHAENCPAGKELINQIGKVYPISRHSIVVGYLNGCLAYNLSSNEAYLLLFGSHDQNNFVATLHKMLFIFFSFVLGEKNRFLVHGAGLEDKHGEGGFLFLGDSGTGKTTVASFAGMDAVLSDDAPVLGTEDGIFYIFSSPFSQVNMFEERSSDYFRKKVQLRRLLFLIKADELRVLPRERHTAMMQMLKSHVHSFELLNRELRISAFNFCYDLCRSIPAYDLYFQKNDKFWDALNGASRGTTALS
ncbi:MAG: hypothetical protein ABSE05_03485 [Syntrophales bacterium]|jgi:hypothetical protein